MKIIFLLFSNALANIVKINDCDPPNAITNSKRKVVARVVDGLVVAIVIVGIDEVVVEVVANIFARVVVEVVAKLVAKVVAKFDIVNIDIGDLIV
ncbi:36120_t:CDS:2 [Gigaspora margarita]|uniref:36120_t:CDS:1 n=1 Tax=Gigaspora margarita TaxID=4874 RepID=A0ABN7V246_GIGMA|nr:36120_t:CDS:2 [Gigaspora margarita]